MTHFMVSGRCLTSINDGAEDKLSSQMVNFQKRQQAAEVTQDIKRWQYTSDQNLPG